MYHYYKYQMFFVMARYISSACVTLTSKEPSAGLTAVVLHLDPVSGCTPSQAAHFVFKSPLVKGVLSKYLITNLTFYYSEL